MSREGYNLDIFVKPPKSELICGLCGKVMCKPCKCKKGHCFCLICISASFINRQECPICKTSLNMDTICISTVKFNKIQDLKVKCQNSFCNWQGTLEQFESTHKSNCIDEIRQEEVVEKVRKKRTKKARVDVEKPVAITTVEADKDDTRNTSIFNNPADLQRSESSSSFLVAAEPLLLPVADAPDDGVVSGLILFSDGRQYRGHILGDMRHGHGLMTDAAGKMLCEGDWLNDKQIPQRDSEVVDRASSLASSENSNIGRVVVYPVFNRFDPDNKHQVQGTLTCKRSGARHDGCFAVTDEGSVMGIGTITFADGQIYTGATVNFERQGKGVLCGADGRIVYDGDWHGDKPHGQGKQVLASGEVYEGSFRSGLRDGKGSVHFSDGGVYTGDVKNGMRHGRGNLMYGNGWVYDGDWLDNAMHGRGKYTSSAGQIYIGSFVFGRMEGNGTMRFANGGSYTGLWKDDLQHGYGTEVLITDEGKKCAYSGDFVRGLKDGRGTMHFASGDVYAFDWKDNKPHGTGKYIFASGDVYEGSFVRGLGEGEGLMKYADGGKYTGSFVLGARDGTGTMDFNNGWVYVGEWRNDKREGQGEERLTTALTPAYYQGAYLNDKRHGEGVRKYKSGSLYVGQWKDDKRHGMGQFTKMEGHVYTGPFVLNVAQGEGRIEYANGTVYSGFVDDFQRHGRGQLTTAVGVISRGVFERDELTDSFCSVTYPDGSAYRGECLKSKRHGVGTLTSADGSTYRGEWRDDQKHGEGVARHINGDVMRGEWENDRPPRQAVITYSRDEAVYTGEVNEDGLRHGHGKIKYSNGESFEGTFVMGRKCGEGMMTTKDGVIELGEFFEV